MVASVGCGPETFTGSTSFGIDFVELGKQAGTETVLAMLQIIDHSLARMRLSTHTTVLAGNGNNSSCRTRRPRQSQ